VRIAKSGIASLLLCFAAEAAHAESRVAFDIARGTLSNSLRVLGNQAGITIGSSDPRLGTIASRSIRGSLTVRQALESLLSGTGYGYTFVGTTAVRIYRLERRAQPTPAPADPTPADTTQVAPDIIITASKQKTPLAKFAGTARVMAIDPSNNSRFGGRGSEAILGKMPMLASTSLGPGRNKLYIRGIADSSFNGPTQSIVGQYLGDLRLTFNAPDPDLRLYDINSVELIEGPQGTLYGSGSLGGTLRLVPNPVRLDRIESSVSGGLMTTRHGDLGGDASAMINLPLLAGRAAVRAVAYRSIDGGYIDDVQRGLDDVNRTSITGARGALAFAPGNDWELELGGLFQSINDDDGQYATRGLPPLSRRSTLAQPFDNDYANGYLKVAKRWSDLELLSVGGVVRHSLETQFDATGFPGTNGPQLFVEDVNITLVSSETRLSRSRSDGSGWVVGFSFLHDINELTRTLGSLGTHNAIAGVRNETTEMALFGQYRFAVTGNVSATLGGRLTYSIAAGHPLDSEDLESDEPKRNDFKPLPTIALTWQPHRRIFLYSRFQQGFRAGGLAVSASGSAMTAQRFASDTLSSFELGARFGRRQRDRFWLDAAISYARWDSMQADLIDGRGLPYTTNLGDGRILGFEAGATWRVSPALQFELSTFINDSALSKPTQEFADADERDLPNIAKAGGRAGFQYTLPISETVGLTLDGSVRYVGRSQLGVGAPIDIPQGKYATGDLGLRLDLGAFGVSLDVTNVGDVRGNRFSFGNPFVVAQRNEVTPLQPRTFRIGFDAAF
jgi:outer membrane receptor protein involved in Fe transport